MRINTNRKLAAVVIVVLILLIPAVASVSADSVGSWSAMDSGTSVNLYAVWGTDNSHVFAAGKSGTILSYNGTSWSAMTGGTTADLYGIWGSSSTNVFAVGQTGTILHYNGTAWSAMTSGSTADLYDIWGAANTDIYAVGKSGNILHYNGTEWSVMASGTTTDLFSIWGTDSSHIFATGKSGVIISYNGTSWSAVASGITADLYGIWGSSGTNIFSVGQSGSILHYDGSTWSALTSGTTADLYGIWGADSSHVFVAGQSGVIFNYDGSAFSSMDRDTSSDLRSVWGASYTDVFITGSSGTILRYSPPIVYTIVPDEGYQGATLNVTINGANFNGARSVQFGAGISVNSFIVVSSTRIDANITITPGAAPGDRDVSVTTSGGSFIYSDGFTVKQALPVITSVEPNQGRQGETLNVTLTGNNFNGAGELQFGAGILVNSFTVLSSNQITASITIAPETAAGPRNVSITTPAGSFTFSGGFTVLQPVPLITSVDPNQERQGETLSVTVSGTNLDGAMSLYFGSGISVNNFIVLNSNQISASITVSSDAVTGSRSVTVTTPGGSYTLSNGFTVKQALPLITSLEPNQGRQGETLNVTLTGTSFSGASVLQFGSGISVNSFTVLSPNQISAGISIASDATAGSRNITVTTPGGSYTLSSGFTVKQAMPVITSVSPSYGNRGSAATLTINGSNLDGVTAVAFGAGIEVTGFSGISPTQLSVNISVAADALTGLRDVSVTTPGGSFTLPGGFMVKQELPLITTLSINSANQGATLTITISGANFTGTTAVQFGEGISVNSFNVIGSSQITADITIAAGAAAGTRDVSVTTPGGSFTMPGSFTVKQALPGITSVNPNSGNPGTTMVVIINGKNLTGTTRVDFGAGIEVISFTNISPTQLSVNISVKADAVLGYRDISITTPGGNTIFAQGFNIELKSRNTAALIAIWTGIAVMFIILSVILHVLRRRRAARL
jgi:hypothetical protein